MRCSGCSEVVRPVVALDIDGTLGDYHGHFIEFATEWLGYLPSKIDYDGRAPFGLWFAKVFNTDLTTFRMIKLAYRQGGLKRTMPAFAGAAELTENIMGAGAEVWITTTRPHDRFDRVDPDTREWLRRNGILFDGLLFGPRKLADLQTRIDPGRVVFVLDDQVEQLEEAKAVGWFTVLRKTGWNSGVWWPAAVTVLSSASRVAEAQINNWREQHGNL